MSFNTQSETEKNFLDNFIQVLTCVSQIVGHELREFCRKAARVGFMFRDNSCVQRKYLTTAAARLTAQQQEQPKTQNGQDDEDNFIFMEVALVRTHAKRKVIKS